MVEKDTLRSKFEGTLRATGLPVSKTDNTVTSRIRVWHRSNEHDGERTKI